MFFIMLFTFSFLVYAVYMMYPSLKEQIELRSLSKLILLSTPLFLLLVAYFIPFSFWGKPILGSNIKVKVRYLIFSLMIITLGSGIAYNMGIRDAKETRSSFKWKFLLRNYSEYTLYGKLDSIAGKKILWVFKTDSKIDTLITVPN